MPDPKSDDLGTYVKSAAVKVLDTGEAETTLSLVGTQKDLERLIGHAVTIQNGTKKMLGRMVGFAVTDKAGKRVCTAKVKGARDLDSLVGAIVRLTKSQMEIPGTEEEG